MPDSTSLRSLSVNCKKAAGLEATRGLVHRIDPPARGFVAQTTSGNWRKKKPRRNGAKDSMRAQPTPLPRRCARQARQMPSLRWRLLISGAGGFGIGGSFSPSPE